MIRLFTRAQNSRSVCQSRPLRARREAPRAKTAPASPLQIPTSRRSKPGRAVPPPPAAEIVVDDNHVLPAEVAGAGRQRVLASSALRIVQELIHAGLPHIDIGAARQMIAGDLSHRPSPPAFRPGSGD